MQSPDFFREVGEQANLRWRWREQLYGNEHFQEGIIAARLRAAMELRPIRNPALIEVRYHSTSAGEAADIANTIARLYCRQTGAELMDEAVESRKPVRPNPFFNLAVGLAFGGVLGLLAGGMTALLLRLKKREAETVPPLGEANTARSTALRIVAGLFIFIGLWSLASLLFRKYVPNINIFPSAIALPIGIGLLNRREWCRRLAVWGVALSFIFTVVMCGWIVGKAFGLFPHLNLVTMFMGRPVENQFATVFLLLLAQLIAYPWFYLTLIRREVRAQFAAPRTRLPWLEWGLLLAIVLLMITGVHVPVQRNWQTGIIFASPPTPPNPININLYAHRGEGNDLLKTGLAAAGLTTNDFWNHYSRDAEDGTWKSTGALGALRRADGSATTAGLLVQNAPGCWGTGSADNMYRAYIYPLDGGTATVTLTNLPAGHYDILIYSPNGRFQLTAGGEDYGEKTCNDPSASGIPAWEEGRQYVRFRSVAVASGEDVVINVLRNPAGYAIVAGLQIIDLSKHPSGVKIRQKLVQNTNENNASAQSTLPTSAFQIRLVTDDSETTFPTDTFTNHVDKSRFELLRLKREVLLDGKAVERAGWHAADGRTNFVIGFTEAGSREFETMTAANLKRRIAIVFQGRVLFAPVIQGRISTRKLEWPVQWDRKDMERTMNALNQMNNPVVDLRFGPEQENILPPLIGTWTFLNLRANRLMTNSRPDSRSRAFREWQRDNGADIAAAAEEKWPIVIACGVATAPAVVNGLENNSPSDIWYNWDLMVNEPEAETSLAKSPNNGPDTYYFRTRDDTWGILQIVGFSDNPRGVKIRYKLVQVEKK